MNFDLIISIDGKVLPFILKDLAKSNDLCFEILDSLSIALEWALKLCSRFVHIFYILKYCNLNLFHKPKKPMRKRDFLRLANLN